MLKYSIVGSAETVRRELEAFVEMTKADELMIVSHLYDHAARIRSYEIIADQLSTNSVANADLRK